MKRKKILFIEEDPDKFCISRDWYFDNCGLYGVDEKNGLIIIGNKDYKEMFYCEERTQDMINHFLEYNMFDADAICNMLSRKLGKEYVYREITGSCQGDWNYAFYPKKEFTKEHIDEIEAVYFGTATFFRGVDSDGDGLEEIVITSFYDDNQIKEKIKELGYKLKDVIIKKLDGTITINKYKTI